MLYSDGSVGCFRFDDCGLSVDRIPVKNRFKVPDIPITQRPRRSSAYISLAHAHHQTDHDGPFHQSPSMLGSRCIRFVNMQRVLIHTQQAE